MKTLNSYFIPHWGWPWNLLWQDYMEKSWEIELKKYLNQLWKNQEDFDAVLLITPHWEEKDITLSFNDDYNLIYDYYGFPKNTYNIDYKVNWDKNIAEKIEKELEKNSIQSKRDYKRWLDHWSFIPLMEIFPNIDKPVIQMSISNNLSAEYHYKVWNALKELKKEKILIIWTGMSYHNMRWFFSNDPIHRKNSIEFNNFIEENINNINKLINWEENSLNKNVHPRSEHFMPFFIILWTSIGWEIEQDIKIDIYNKEIIWYKVK